jgi:N-acetylglutamate synthase-like GNAT family acetyltransferase
MGKRKRGRTKHRVKGKTKRRVKGKTKRRINRSRRMGGSDLVRTSARERDIERAKEYLQEMGFQEAEINNIKRHIEGQGKLFNVYTLEGIPGYILRYITGDSWRLARDIERAKEYLQEMGFQAGQINNIKRHIEGQGKLFTIPTLYMACLSILSKIPYGCLPEKSSLDRTPASEGDIERAKEYLQEMGFQAGQINNIKRHIEGQGKLFTIPTLRMACLSILSEIPDGCLPEKSSWDEW